MDLNTLLNLLNQGTQTGPSSPPGSNVPVGPLIIDTQAPQSTPLLRALSEQLPLRGSPDIYHSSAVPTSPSLLAASGVSAYVQLLGALSAAGSHETSANLMTRSLLEASATLKSAYYQAASQLPPQLQAKDWRFSVSGGKVVFTKGRNELSAHDLVQLRQAFAGAKVEMPAKQVAAAITLMQLKRNSGADAGSLAWGRFEVDETNFGRVVDLRAFVTATAPGGEYNPDAANQMGTNAAASGPNAFGQTVAAEFGAPSEAAATAQTGAGQMAAGEALAAQTGSSPTGSSQDGSNLLGTNRAAAHPANLANLANLASPNPTNRSDVPLNLGGMYLGDLVTSRPDFFKSEHATKPEAMLALEAPRHVEAGAILQGRCSCGEVRFTVEDEVEYAFYCHCSRCRLRTGSVFAAVAAVSIDKVEVTAGDKSLLIEGECSDGYGARCSQCHTFLFAAVRGRQYLHISLGALAGAPSRLPDHHIYVGSKAPWYQITDGLPQYEELP